MIKLWKSLHGWTKHSIVALAVGIVARLLLMFFGLFFQKFEIGLTLTACAIWLLITLSFEMSQKNHNTFYSFTDGLMDMLFGNVYFWIPMLIGSPIWHEIF